MASTYYSICSRVKFLVLIICCCSCSGGETDYAYVKERRWAWDKGFSVGRGDVLFFGGDTGVFILRHDTILYQQKPRALVVELDKEMFNLTVRSIETGETGYYRDEGESLKRR